MFFYTKLRKMCVCVKIIAVFFTIFSTWVELVCNPFGTDISYVFFSHTALICWVSAFAHNDFSRSHSNPPNDPIFLDQSLFDNHLGKLEIQSVWTDKQYCGRSDGWFEKLEKEKLGLFSFSSKLDFFFVTQ